MPLQDVTNLNWQGKQAIYRQTRVIKTALGPSGLVDLTFILSSQLLHEVQQISNIKDYDHSKISCATAKSAMIAYNLTCSYLVSRTLMTTRWPAEWHDRPALREMQLTASNCSSALQVRNRPEHARNHFSDAHLVFRLSRRAELRQP